MRGHFGCILKATEEYTTGVWWAWAVGVLYTYNGLLNNGPCVTSVAGKKKRATMRMVIAMAMCGFMRG
jgi:hypothetical protein